MNPTLVQFFDRLKASGFAEIPGARVVADIPLPDEALNRLLAGWVGAAASRSVRELRVQATHGNRADVHVRLAKFSFVPLQIHLFIEQQPEIPAFPILVLRWRTVNAAVTALASRAAALLADLPHGVVMGGDRVAINIFAVLQTHGLGWAIPLVEQIWITTEPGRMLLHVAFEARSARAGAGGNGVNPR